MIESTKDLSLSDERQRSPTKPSESEEAAEATDSKPSQSDGALHNNEELVALNPKKVRFNLYISEVLKSLHKKSIVS